MHVFSLNTSRVCFVLFFPAAESRPHGLVMQEDIWDADVDLHQRLLKRWRELKEQSGLEWVWYILLQTRFRLPYSKCIVSLMWFSCLFRVEAFFEVNTDLQKNVQAKILAQLTWPSLVNSSQQIHFPLTNTNSSSVSVYTSTQLTLTHFTMLKSTIVFSLKSNTFTWAGVIVGRGSDSRKLSRCPSLRSGSSFGSLPESLSVHRQTCWQVRHFLCNKPVIDVIDPCIWCDVFSCMKTYLYCLWEIASVIL